MMKINGLNSIANVYKANKAYKVTNKAKVGGKDQVELSTIAKDFQYAKEIGKQVPDVRMDKVEDIQNRIHTGTYNVKGEEVARKLMESGFDFKA